MNCRDRKNWDEPPEHDIQVTGSREKAKLYLDDYKHDFDDCWDLINFLTKMRYKPLGGFLYSANSKNIHAVKMLGYRELTCDANWFNRWLCSFIDFYP